MLIILGHLDTDGCGGAGLDGGDVDHGSLDRPPRKHDIMRTGISCFRENAMKNVTVSMDDRLAREVRVEAAKAGKSMSRYISEVVEAAIRGSAAGEVRNRQLEAIEAILSGPGWDVTENGRMPTRCSR